MIRSRETGLATAPVSATSRNAAVPPRNTLVP